jgi:hypothetical protein
MAFRFWDNRNYVKRVFSVGRLPNEFISLEIQTSAASQLAEDRQDL